MLLLFRLVLVLVLAARTCESAALGASGRGGEDGVAPEDMAVIRELEELNQKIRVAAKFTKEHQSQARVVQQEETFDREEYEASDNATEIPLVETTASSSISSVTVNASVATENELTSPPTETTSADALLEAISSVLSTVTSNTTSLPSSPSISVPVTSNTTTVPSTSNTSATSVPPELGNDIDNGSPSIGQDIQNNIINPVLPGEFKAHIGNVVAPEDVDRLHSFQSQQEPSNLAHQQLHVPEQPSGGDFLCPNRYYRLGRTCYRPSDQRLSFFGATQDCRAENGDLAIIKDPPTHRFVIQLIQTYRPSESHWIGLSDVLREGIFVWADGIPLEGTSFWARGQPNNLGAGQHCVYMYPAYAYRWVDGECLDQHYYICQQPAVNSVDQLLYSYLYNIGIGSLGEPAEGGYLAHPTPSD